MPTSPVRTGRERCIRASAVFWFLSGIRIRAFVTLPIKAIDLNALAVKQWPSLGVQTKNRKHATTYLLNIPDLLDVVREWDEEVRTVLPGDALWFAHLVPETNMIDTSRPKVGKYRTTRARKDLQDWLTRVGLQYHSPHMFRHGNAVYSLMQCQDVADFKAVSQNLMHANLSVTDGVYGMLSDDDVGQRIGALGQTGTTTDLNALAAIAKRILDQENASKENK
jgi:site-specific recombinase XerC